MWLFNWCRVLVLQDYIVLEICYTIIYLCCALKKMDLMFKYSFFLDFYIILFFISWRLITLQYCSILITIFVNITFKFR